MVSLALALYRCCIAPTFWLASHVGALFFPKWRARLQELRRTIDLAPEPQRPRLWVHVASMGELEQIIPVIERLRDEWSVVASFTSMSGLQHGRRLSHLIDSAFLLPVDSQSRMRALVSAILPNAVLLSRYDVWPMMLRALHERSIPVVLANATAPSHLQWPLSALYADIYSRISAIYAVDARSAATIESLAGRRIDVLPDTRYDRVLQATQAHKSVHPTDLTTIVFGSVWDADIDHISEALQSLHATSIRVIIVPHEPTEERLRRVERALTVRRSGDVHSIAATTDNIVVDTVGGLLQLYGLADAAYIGGGFGFNVHSVAEPAAYGIPLSCGPAMNRSVEARALVLEGGLIVVATADDLRRWIETITMDVAYRSTAGAKNSMWIRRHAGSSAIIAKELARYSRAYRATTNGTSTTSPLTQTTDNT